MLEESRMDKNPLNRSSQIQSKAPAVDCKKKSDLTHNKHWLRNNNKKRESSSNAPKNEPHRKNLPPFRGSGPMDRRPSRRNDGYIEGGTAVAGLVKDQPVLGSVLAPGRKKQSLNYLLNFMYTPRGGDGHHRGGAPPPLRRYNSQTARRHNQDMYLQASCQFVLKKSGDYTVNLTDPDVRIDWNQIEEIILRASTIATCPICLCEPVAARVGRCGHPICWACALHYNDVHEQKPPPCPVCLGPLPLKILKPARSLIWSQPTEEVVSFSLVRRLRGSTVVELAPPHGKISALTPQIQNVERMNNSPYSKLFTANEQQVQNILERERKELQDQILAEVDTTEIVYIEQALQMLKDQENNMKVCASYVPDVPSTCPESVPIVYEKLPDCNYTIDWFDYKGDEKLDEIGENMEKCKLNPHAPVFGMEDVFETQVEFPIVEQLENEDRVDEQTDIDKDNLMKYFYFYQATDGQEVFLHNINVRMLNKTWGSMQAGPELISGKVLRRETFSLTEQQRKHMPCATHLPLHCPIDIVELDLKPPYVSKQAIDSFHEELDRRAKVRARMKQKERRRERAYQLQMQGPSNPDFSSETQFPPASPSNYVSAPIEPSPPEVTNEPSTSGANIQSPTGVSFAKMAASSQGVWKVRPNTFVPAPVVVNTPPEEGDALAPRALNLSDAIEAALHAAPTSSKGRKKKTKKKSVLFG